jgi:ComF family protein
LIHLFKYGKIPTLARPIADLVAAALPRGEQFDFVVPTPLHWWRRWVRGFNQSELLAREIARRTGLPMLRALRRVRATSVQAGLSNSERRRNVAGAFHARRAAAALKGGNILLIDDVMTTGSTGAACASTLKRVGAARVTLLTAARVDRRLDGFRQDLKKGAGV